ncbi:hypothetical protein AABC73_13950 [Pseudomonas sp. G.S.17]|uniref:hypothetical protein n=1 Tax=Pseudomonas sp. G.S.17 TaxID=3137451 RepID=UPI00311C9297
MGVSTRQVTDQYLLLQGRQFALDLVESFGQQLYSAKGIADAVKRLSAATENKPESYALGINNIVDVLKNASNDLPESSAGEAREE